MPGKINFKPPPDRQALGFLKAKGLKTSFNWKDIYGAEHAYAFTVAKVETMQLLSHFKNSLTDALEQGQTFRDWKKNIEPVIRRSGWMGIQEKIDPLTGELVTAKLGTPRRLRVIFDTNMRQARHAGHWERVQEVKKNLPYLEYRLGPSEEHRPEHAAWDGLVLPVDDAWWNTHHPQNGWGCKCWTRQLTRLQAQKRGIGQAPPLEERSMVNNRTGEVIQVPKGIDPGFEFNPGKQRTAIDNPVYQKPFDDAPRDIARAAIGDAMASPDIVNIMKNTEIPMTIGALDEQLANKMGLATPFVRMSSGTAKKMIANHGELLAKDYQSIPDLIDAAQVIRTDNNKGFASYHFLFQSTSVKYVMACSPTADGTTLLLATFRRSNKDDFKAITKKTRLFLKRR